MAERPGRRMRQLLLLTFVLFLAVAAELVVVFFLMNSAKGGYSACPVDDCTGEGQVGVLVVGGITMGATLLIGIIVIFATYIRADSVHSGRNDDEIGR